MVLNHSMYTVYSIVQCPYINCLGMFLDSTFLGVAHFVSGKDMTDETCDQGSLVSTLK